MELEIRFILIVGFVGSRWRNPKLGHWVSLFTSGLSDAIMQELFKEPLKM